MRCRNVVAAIAAGLALCVPISDASAHSPKPRRHVHAQALPSQDAVELAVLAPAARRSTETQTYGDAVFARSMFQRRYGREERADREQAAAVGVPYPCEPRRAGPDAYVCLNDPRQRGYGQDYAFTPPYVSAPQNFDADPNAQTSMLPAATGFFWAVNSMRLDPH